MYFPQSVASGDPKPNSVMLWTRAVDSEATTSLDLELEVFTDEGLQQAVVLDQTPYVVTASADRDGCVKVRIEGLDPATTYWYRFVYVKDGVAYATHTGRTKTAPLPDQDVPVRFAFVSCQDYIGRYYNAHAHLAEQDLDFIVHLGDYVYETTGDASFQSTGGPRSISFEDDAGALTIGTGDASFQAARSLDNYRQLYRTYRADEALQRVHERFPMIVIWDDHEFSDDCYGATSTYLDGREDETDIERRQNANQAWFEYMPVDYRTEDFEYDRSTPPPDDISIYRDFAYGQHLHLVMTDLRSRRTDHGIPEDAYPGTVVIDEATLTARGAIPAFATPYVPDIDAFADGAYATMLHQAAMAEGYPTEGITGPISALWINAVATAVESTPIAEDVLATLPRGVSWFDMGKSGLYTSVGSRYVVNAPPYELYSTLRYENDPTTEDLMGPDQEAWFLSTMQNTTATWKVWGNEFCLLPLQLDLTGNPLAPPELQNRFVLNQEDWNGVPSRRDQLLEQLAAIGNVVAVTGDIHAFFAGNPTTSSNARIVEFVGSSISSGGFAELLNSQVATVPNLDPTLAGALIIALPDLLVGPGAPNGQLAFADPNTHGYVVVEADGEALETTYYQHAAELIETQAYDDPALDEQFEMLEFRVENGSPDLYNRQDGAWVRWDNESREWV